jgi:hypothetical protein
MLGTADKPGPVTSMLRSGAEQTAAWNDMLRKGYNPVPTQSQFVPPYATAPTPSAENPVGTKPTVPTVPTVPIVTPSADQQQAARGGIMSLQGYAAGGTAAKAAADKAAKAKAAADKAAKDKAAKGKADAAAAKQAEVKKTAVTAATVKALQTGPKNETAPQKAARIQKIIDLGGAPNPANTTFMQNYTDSSGNKYEGNIDLKTGIETPRPKGPTESSADYTKYLTGAAAAGATITAAQKKQYPNVDTTPPKTAEQATADANLKNTIGTSITNVTADTEPVWKDGIVGGTIIGYKSTNEDFQKLQQAARDLKTPEQFKTATDMYGRSSAGLEAAAGYKPTDISANKADVANAEASGYNAASMNAPKDIAAQKANVATMQGAGDVASDKLQQYQMQGPGAVTAPTAEASQMAGPKSWIDKGTSEAYMSPYMQNVVDIQKREANRDYLQELNKLNAQSVQAGAFGGSRQAIQQAEAARNQATRLGDIEAKGLQEAYTSGMGQFTNEQGQQLQAGQANLTASQQTTLANQAAEIQAMMANQGMDYNTALQNLQAKLGIQNTQAGNDLQAALANQNIQQQTQATNMAAQNQAEQAYVQQALEAARTNYGGQLTAEQQNQVAQNASAQYNATNQQNVNLTNTAAQNAANNAYVQNQLTAQQANQQAGLTANQQGIAALQGVGQNASGLSSTGTAENQAGIANLGAQGQVVQAQQALSQAGVNANQQTAQNALGATNQINAGSVAAVNAQPVSGGTSTGQTTNNPATWARGGLIKNGKVSKRGVK